MSRHRRSTPVKTITPNDESLIVTLYREGVPAREILVRLGNRVKTTKTVYDVLRKWEVPRKAGPQSYNPIVHDYFSNIDTREKAYLLGFLVADGWVYPTRNQVGIRLISADSWVLNLLKRETKSMANVQLIKPRRHTFPQGHTSISQEHAQLIISSRRMVLDLANLGIIEAKTGFEVLPIVPAALQNHVLRGNLDGDGSIYSHSSGGRTCIRFTGSRYLTGQVSLLLHLTLGVSYRFPSHRTDSPDLSYVEWSTENDCQAIARYLYADSEGLRLERKYEKAKGLLD